ncbi:MAG: ggt [Herminiimonas sp.]|nr:ggt [Herminiimonas sp.]
MNVRLVFRRVLPGRSALKATLVASALACVLQDGAAEARFDLIAQREEKPPEAASGYTEKPGWLARQDMVAAANPLATHAGREILAAGGSAVDAAIAMQMVLGLVEPQSSGIGGGGFLLHFDGKGVQVFDGRETAPASATEKLFQTEDGKAMRFFDRVVGGRAVGVPGVLRMLELAHRQYGKLPWATLFSPAIRLAEEGFAVSPRLALLIRNDSFLRRDPVAAVYFYDRTGAPWPAGHVLKNPELADVLRDVASRGADAFYLGPVARDIVAKVRSHPVNPGELSVADLAGYKALVREPVCRDYRKWKVCGVPPPSSGGIVVAQMLGILEGSDLAALPPREMAGTGRLQPRAEAVHLVSEAGRLAYADRARFVADTDFVPLPGNSLKPLLAPAYLAQRAALIGPRSMGRARPGTPVLPAVGQGTDTSPELPSTSHLVAVDRYGGAVAMTSTIEDAFGARQMVRGFLLNNQLTDFSADPADAVGPVANRVQPGKRPRSAMSPTMVFDKSGQQLLLAIGSPGGSAIPNYVVKVLVGVLDWGLDLQQAINLPNFGSRNGPTELELGRFDDDVRAALTARGHDLREAPQTSGLHGLMRVTRRGEGYWFGAADPRREGVAEGN